MACGNTSQYQDYSTLQLWIAIAAKLLSLQGKQLPAGIDDWGKKKVMEYVVQNLGCIDSVITN